MTSQRPYLSKGIFCIKCQGCICKPRYKKYPDPDIDYQMLCGACSDENPMLRAFNRMRSAMFPDEFEAFDSMLKELLENAKLAEEYCKSMQYENPGYHDSSETVRKTIEMIANTFNESDELVEGRD